MNRNFSVTPTRLTFLFAFILISFCSYAQKVYLLTGTYTTGGSKGIYVYNFNASTGKAKWVGNTDSVTNPSYITLSKNGNYVYAVNETNGAVPGKVSAFSFNKKNGKLHFLNFQLSGGDDPCYLETNSDDKWLAVANYTGGSTAMFPLNKNGTLKPYAELMQDSGSSINKDRQEKAHVHETRFSPDYKYLLTPDLGMDKIMIYQFNPLMKKPLRPALSPYFETTPGSGPRHITFHPNKKFAYLVSELAGTVTAFKYRNGKLSELQSISAHPEDFKGVIGSAEIVVSPDGRFLYVSNRGDENTITIFSINLTSGKLKLKNYQSTLGKGPRNFIIDPTGNYLLVANQDSDNIVIFKRNKQTGLLKETGEQITVSKPVCLQMIKVQ
ncbi:MAG: lactonase family protein [Bacteroidota bacterium]|nr:lactonase family protein [Bacteroidota bacterium]